MLIISENKNFLRLLALLTIMSSCYCDDNQNIDLISLNNGAIKSMENSAYDNIDKRVPSGFLGMRGKKLNYDVSPEVAAGLFPDSLVEDSDHFRNAEDDQGISLASDKYKKALTAGSLGRRSWKIPSRFLGMRGKKEDNISDWMRLTQAWARNNKRIPRGFLGMRGKKSVNYGIADEDDNIHSPSYTKRVPYSFLGMRG